MNKVAQIQELTITPVPGASRDEVARCDQNRATVSHVLCIYLLERYPKCIDTMKAQQQAFNYITKEETHQRELIELCQKRMHFVEDHARMIVMDSVRYDLGDFIYTNSASEEITLFNCRRHPLQNICYEALFLIQLMEQESTLQEKHRAFFNDEMNRLGGSTRDFWKRDNKTCSAYLELLPKTIERWEKALIVIKSSDLSRVQRADLEPIYNELIKTARYDMELLCPPGIEP